MGNGVVFIITKEHGLQSIGPFPVKDHRQTLAIRENIQDGLNEIGVTNYYINSFTAEYK